MKDKDCVFCDIARERIIAENEYCVAFYDLHSVTEQVKVIMIKIFEYFEFLPGWKPKHIFPDDDD